MTGAAGQLGAELGHALAPHGEIVSTDRSTLDLADASAIAATVRRVRPALIVNAGAYTSVDLAETETAAADAINATAPGVLAEEAKRAGALLVHWSTDYVFDGAKRTPYDEDDAARPLSAYGRSKLAGERAIAASGADALVFRTSWIYARRGRNFLLTMQRLARERGEVRVVDDQTGVPNWCRAIARATSQLVGHGIGWLAERGGLYHLSAGGATTWYGFAKAILADAPATRVVPITTAEYPTPARRPAYGVLGTAKFERTFGFALPSWRETLDECLASAPEPGVTVSSK